jgi:hypothetical protein
MTDVMLEAFAKRLVGGLKRKSITTCSAWAEKYRVMGMPYPGRWSFEHHPWTRDMHDDKREMIVGQKAAQMGYTEVALNKVFYSVDILGESVLYVLPSATPDASVFSTSRFDPALELSPHLADLFSDVKNIGHKRAGSANLFIRGSRSRSQLKSLPVGKIIFDELDEMDQANVTLAFERTSGQLEKQIFALSTPTIENYGINALFRVSSQDHFYFPCPHCGRKVELTFPECLVITADDWTSDKIRDTHIICPLCKHKLEHKAKPEFLKHGKWVPTTSDCTVAGYYINQLYSCVLRPDQLAISYLKSLTNPADEQEFYNSKLGLTHAVEGSRVTDTELIACTGQHNMSTELPKPGRVRCIGIDVGKYLHYWIGDYKITPGAGSDLSLASDERCVQVGKVLQFEELDAIIKDAGIMFGVVDANPERRKSMELCQRFWGRVRMCFYANGVSGRDLNWHADEAHSVSVDRTSWLDVSLGRFHTKRITLPIDLPIEAKVHLKAQTRIYEKDATGNPVGRYVCGNDEDHYAHAHNYCEIALQMLLKAGKHADIP